MLAIAWQYLTGRAVAATHDKRAVEWPPHPDRAFQALVAAWGERGCDPDERQTLEWLETLGPPELAAPEVPAAARSVMGVFVPINDTASPLKGSGSKLKSCSEIRDLAIGRDRQPRSFASAHVGEEAVCALIWPDADPAPEQRARLVALCAAVTHLGHSRSLVRMWLTNTPPPSAWVPREADRRRDASLRIPYAGRLAALVAAFSDGGPDWTRPPTAPWHAYIRVRAATDAIGSPFDPRLIVLRHVGGEGQPGLTQAPAFVQALRGTLMATASTGAMPLVSGHQADGSPIERPHVAWMPLAYVGGEHADGHLMGMAMALPRDLPADDEQAIFDAMANALKPDNEGRFALTLCAGCLGTMNLVPEERPVPPLALRPATWTHPAISWGTVTPIALDRLPPRRHEDTDAWATAQVRDACLRQGLPAPCEVRILPVSPFAGAPTARGFPPLLRKPDGARRWHVHAALRFPQAIAGPLLLGAGRYQGYGLCKPLFVGTGCLSPADSPPLADAGQCPSRPGSLPSLSDSESGTT